MAYQIPAPPIVPGYAYRVRVAMQGDEPIFPAGCRLRSDVRRFVYSDHAIAVLTTENGGLTRLDDNEIEVLIGADQTAMISGCSVMIDFVRTDLDPEAFQYIQIKLPVMFPVTRQ